LRKNAVCPSYTLHHLVRERYPRFLDALSDLDDALTLTFLFAALPTTTSVKSKVIAKAQQMGAAWGAYCSTVACITKSFISVKGVYLEATIQGVAIRWIVPHSFTQFMPEDVDYRVMTTFFEFYETLLHFVLFKLYNDIGVRYPLQALGSAGEVKGTTSYILGANLLNLKNAFSSTSTITNTVSETVDDGDKKSSEAPKKSKAERKKEKELIKTVGAALSNINEEDSDENEDDDDVVDIAGPLKAALQSMADDEARLSIPGGADASDDEALKRRRLFAGLTFFLSREVPRGYLELVCLAFGGKVGWEGPNSSIDASDPTITHHVVDRPRLPALYDSLPKSREFVQPQWILDCSNFMFLLPIAKYAVGVSLPPHLSPWIDHDEEGYKPAYAEEIERLKNGESIMEEMIIDPLDKTEDTTADSESVEGSDDVDSEDENQSEDEDIKARQERTEKHRKKEEEEAHALAKTMMSRKASHLYGRMQNGINKKKAQVETLKTRRREIEHSKKNDTTGKTPLKQKVERLKKERSAIAKEYSNSGGSLKRSKKKRRVES
jgi:pescadillo